MTIRDLICILIDAPDKDKPVDVEYIQREVEQNNDGNAWNQLAVTQVVIYGGGCSLEVHPYQKERLVNG